MQKREKCGKQNVTDIKRRLPRLFGKPCRSKESIIKLVYFTIPWTCFVYFIFAFDCLPNVVLDFLMTCHSPLHLVDTCNAQRSC